MLAKIVGCHQRDRSIEKIAIWGHTLMCILLDFSLTVKAAPHECIIRTSQP